MQNPPETVAAHPERMAAETPARPRWNWHGFFEGLRDEGVPMSGMVGGAALGLALGKRYNLERFGLTPDKLAVGGSGIGYGMASLGNLAFDPIAERVRSAWQGTPPEHHGAAATGSTPPIPARSAMKAASGDGLGTFIPGAVGATIGAAIGGGLTQDEANKGRNMLAGAGAGYAVGDVGMLAKALFDHHRAQRAAHAARTAASTVAHGFKLAVDTETLHNRVFAAKNVHDLTGTMTPMEALTTLSTGGAGTNVRHAQMRNVATMPAINQTGEASRAQFAALLNDPGQRAAGGTIHIHPEIAARTAAATAGVPDLSPQGVRANSAFSVSHELAERAVKPRDALLGYGGHLSPDVLMKEHNMLSTLTGPGAEEVRHLTRAMRAGSGEADHLRQAFTTAFRDPRAAQFLEEGQKIPKAMRNAMLTKIRANPTGILGHAMHAVEHPQLHSRMRGFVGDLFSRPRI